jgi:hypothetical protein
MIASSFAEAGQSPYHPSWSSWQNAFGNNLDNVDDALHNVKEVLREY